MIFKDNNLTINKYESIIVPKEKRRINDKYIYSIVSREIEKATIADVPVGVYLSGGIDSSVITASLYNKGFEDINTFSVGFEDKNVVNELPFAREIANKFNTNHHEVSFTSEDCIKYFDDIVYTLDEPVADTTIFPVYFLSKLASKNVKVVLSGVGGDEVFAGYPQYRFVYYWSNYIKKFGLQKPTSYLLTNFILRNKSDKAKELFSNIKSQNNYEDVFKTVMNRLYSDEELKKLVYNYNSKDLLSSDSFNNKLDYMQYYDLVGNVQNNYLIFSDKINLLNGVEGRVPLLNKNIINLGFSLKDNQRLNYNSGKLALKKAYKDYLPKSILTRKKYGFTSPLKSWFETGFYNELENLSQNNEITKYFDKAELDKLILSKDYNKLWRLLIFMKWHKVYFD